jgi:hypothetical protein
MMEVRYEQRPGYFAKMYKSVQNFLLAPSQDIRAIKLRCVCILGLLNINTAAILAILGRLLSHGGKHRHHNQQKHGYFHACFGRSEMMLSARTII